MFLRATRRMVKPQYMYYYDAPLMSSIVEDVARVLKDLVGKPVSSYSCTIFYGFKR